MHYQLQSPVRDDSLARERNERARGNPSPSVWSVDARSITAGDLAGVQRRKLQPLPPNARAAVQTQSASGVETTRYPPMQMVVAQVFGNQRGELDRNCVLRVMHPLFDIACDQSHDSLIIDVSEVTTISHAFVQVIEALLVRFENQHRRLCLYGVPASCQPMFTGLEVGCLPVVKEMLGSRFDDRD